MIQFLEETPLTWLIKKLDDKNICLIQSNVDLSSGLTRLQ